MTIIKESLEQSPSQQTYELILNSILIFRPMICSSTKSKNEFVTIVKFIDQIYDAILAYVVDGERKIDEKYSNVHMADLCQKMGSRIASVVLYCKV